MVELKIVRPRDFIRATTEGEFDLATSKALLIEILTAASGSEEYDILIDLRKGRVVMSITDIYEIVRELERNRRIFCNKVAILEPGVRESQKAVTMELFAKNRGLRVEVFTDFEQAVGWLYDTPPPNPRATLWDPDVPAGKENDV